MLKNQKGFTLIELVIIIILIGVLAAVAIPKYVDLRDNAARAASQATLDAGRAGVTLDFASKVLTNGNYISPFGVTGVVDVGDAELATIEGFLEASPSYPTSGSYGTTTDGNFRWYVVAVGSTTLAAAPVPPELSGIIDSPGCTVQLPSGSVGEDCDVREF
ncbi:MAG: prepilin-type N-terminal cleavage/methylation domain-containing protein [candidate division NC10 bacterium]|nr:prepilin-type N-terminal cleavage/methylation domain-containing protein [candidate division NC10 bacterium]